MDQATAQSGASLLQIRDLKMHFPIKKGVFKKVVGHIKAVDGISFDIDRGETVGLVGESGCGKSTASRAILRVYKPTAGEVLYTAEDGAVTDLASVAESDLAPFRRRIRVVFQDPQSSLNPRLPVADIIGEVLKVNGIASGRELEDRVADLMRKVGLRPEYMRRYPHAFSGGERQRIGIARALAPEPRLVIADEAVSALDVSVRAQTINLMQDLQQEFGLTYLFVSHDLSVVQHICNRVAVMYVGRIVEIATVEELFASPRHPYTEALLSAVPVPDPRQRGRSRRIRLAGEVADPADPPSGCAFHPRCKYATELCAREAVPLKPVGAGHRQAACHYADELKLQAVRETRIEGAM